MNWEYSLWTHALDCPLYKYLTNPWKIDQPLRSVHNKSLRTTLFLEAWLTISVRKVADIRGTDGMHFQVSLGGKKEMANKPVVHAQAHPNNACMRYFPTFGPFYRQMLVNIPYIRSIWARPMYPTEAIPSTPPWQFVRTIASPGHVETSLGIASLGQTAARHEKSDVSPTD